jgi:hypothetical protein
MKRGEVYSCADCGADVLDARTEPGGEGSPRPLQLDAQATRERNPDFRYALEDGRARRVGYGFDGLRFREHSHPPARQDGTESRTDA